MYLLLQRSSIIASAVLLLVFQLANAKIGAVSVFRRDEVDLHKYSAVLAAIEPFRMQLSEEVKKSINPINYAFHRMKGNCIISGSTLFNSNFVEMLCLKY